jgi:hypothetical protein
MTRQTHPLALHSSDLFFGFRTGFLSAAELHISPFLFFPSVLRNGYPGFPGDALCTRGGAFLLPFEMVICLFYRKTILCQSIRSTGGHDNEEVLSWKAGFRKDLFVPLFAD